MIASMSYPVLNTGTAATTNLDITYQPNTTTGGLTYTQSSYTSFPTIDIIAFETEWKKFRSEFLPLLLKDSPYSILGFNMSRVMDPKTKKIKVILTMEYEPGPTPKKGVRRTV